MLISSALLLPMYFFTLSPAGSPNLRPMAQSFCCACEVIETPHNKATAQNTLNSFLIDKED
jgi:hypothetical protein